MVYLLILAAMGALYWPMPAVAQDTRLSTNCKLHPYSLVCAGYDVETAKRIIQEEDERRAREAAKAEAEHAAAQKAKQDRKAKAAKWVSAVKGGNKAPVQPLPAGSKWDISVDLSKFDDTLKLVGILDADEFIRVRHRSLRPRLVIRCMEDTTSTYVSWDTFITTERATIEYRIDKRSKYEERWYVSSDHQATGLWSGPDAIPFLKELMDGKAMLVRVTPYGESPVTAEFSLAGVKEVISNVRTACAW